MPEYPSSNVALSMLYLNGKGQIQIRLVNVQQNTIANGGKGKDVWMDIVVMDSLVMITLAQLDSVIYTCINVDSK